MDRSVISSIAVSAVLASAVAVGATNGISVTGHWSGSSYAVTDYTLSRFDIENDYVVKITPLYTAVSGQKGACKPSINMAGTHVAFNRHDIKAGKWYLSIMDIEKGEGGPVYDLTETERVDLEWPSDQWIYYTKGGQLWKINPSNKTQNQLVWTLLGSSVPSLRMSSDGSRMHCFYMAGDEDTRGWFERKNDGSYGLLSTGGGCSPALSPSGLLRVWHVDAGHIAHIFTTWSGTENTQFYIVDDTLNVWGMKTWPGTDRVMMCTYYQYQGPRPIGYGSSTTGHGWANNSDKWILDQTGTDSRYLDCGSNQIAFNYVDKKAINITKGVRSCKEDKERILCDIADADIPGGTTDKHAETGDLWISSLDDVNADLRCYVASREQWKMYWTAVLAGQQATQPACGSVAVVDGRGTLSRAMAHFGGCEGAARTFDCRGRAISARARGIRGRQIRIRVDSGNRIVLVPEVD